LNRVVKKRPVLALLVMALVSSAVGCAGGVRANSWTGVALVEGTLFVADLERVRAMNPETGDTQWTFPAGDDENRGTFYVTPAVDKERVFVASQTVGGGFFGRTQYIVWALDRETGRELWQSAAAAGPYVEGGAVSDGVLVIGSSDGNVYALDVETGAQKWVHSTGHRVWTTPLTVEGVAYVGSMDRHLYALNVEDGSLVWDSGVDGAFTGTPAWQDGKLFVGAFDDRLYAFDAGSGEEIWRFDGGNWFWGGPAVEGSTVYATDVNGTVYALSSDTGEELWQTSLGDAVRSGPSISADGARLVVGSKNGSVYALDTSDGFVVWTKEGEGQVLTAPALDESVLYVTSIYAPYRVRALHIENGREMWVYPAQEEG
jgi:outer membrane protein assembly factor BamB